MRFRRTCGLGGFLGFNQFAIGFPFRCDITSDAAIALEHIVLRKERPGTDFPMGRLSRLANLKMAGDDWFSACHGFRKFAPALLRGVGTSCFKQCQFFDILGRFPNNLAKARGYIGECPICIAFPKPVACARFKVVEEEGYDVLLVVHFLCVGRLLQLIAMVVENHAGKNEAVNEGGEREGEANLPPEPRNCKRERAGDQGAEKNGGGRHAREGKSPHRGGSKRYTHDKNTQTGIGRRKKGSGEQSPGNAKKDSQHFDPANIRNGGQGRFSSRMVVPQNEQQNHGNY